MSTTTNDPATRLGHAFWLDWDYDRSYADSETRSRYGNYLHSRAGWISDIADYDDPTVPFAVAAWQIARGPIMSPPLVHSHPRVLGADVQRSEWNGEAVAIVDLIVPTPAALADARPAGGGWYYGWSTDTWGEYEGVGGQELEKRAYLQAQAKLMVQLQPGFLPKVETVPTGGQQLLDLATATVEAIVSELNRHVGPLIARVDS